MANWHHGRKDVPRPTEGKTKLGGLLVTTRQAVIVVILMIAIAVAFAAASVEIFGGEE